MSLRRLQPERIPRRRSLSLVVLCGYRRRSVASVVILPPGFGIKAKRFTEGNEGNEEFAYGFGIEAASPFVTS
ncbi:MAG: hypothetical protein AUI36_44740 [Cyanobacteria bacterium 13_1_40CM_2_61_4]|nr:MAG: hypothetical protein AUI36_44740 [Cyanobacteria bacterium 13_1_40CM_2_61_4]